MKNTAKKTTPPEMALEISEAEEETTKLALSKQETAAYIADIVLQLRKMAKRADLKFLAYFLEMAFQEAFSQSASTSKSTQKTR